MLVGLPEAEVKVIVDRPIKEGPYHNLLIAFLNRYYKDIINDILRRHYQGASEVETSPYRPKNFSVDNVPARRERLKKLFQESDPVKKAILQEIVLQQYVRLLKTEHSPTEVDLEMQILGDVKSYIEDPEEVEKLLNHFKEARFNLIMEKVRSDLMIYAKGKKTNEGQLMILFETIVTSNRRMSFEEVQQEKNPIIRAVLQASQVALLQDNPTEDRNQDWIKECAKSMKKQNIAKKFPNLFNGIAQKCVLAINAACRQIIQESEKLPDGNGYLIRLKRLENSFDKAISYSDVRKRSWWSRLCNLSRLGLKNFFSFKTNEARYARAIELVNAFNDLEDRGPVDEKVKISMLKDVGNVLARNKLAPSGEVEKAQQEKLIELLYVIDPQDVFVKEYVIKKMGLHFGALFREAMLKKVKKMKEQKLEIEKTFKEDDSGSAMEIDQRAAFDVAALPTQVDALRTPSGSSSSTSDSQHKEIKRDEKPKTTRGRASTWSSNEEEIRKRLGDQPLRRSSTSSGPTERVFRK